MPRYANLQGKNELNLLGQARKKAGIAKIAVYEKLLVDHRKLKGYETGKEPPEIIQFVLDAATLYRDPALPERYCAEMCAIGQRCRRSAEIKDLTVAVLGVLASHNNLQAMENRLIEIAQDGIIDQGERPDFERIITELSKLGETIEALRLWAIANLEKAERRNAA